MNSTQVSSPFDLCRRTPFPSTYWNSPPPRADVPCSYRTRVAPSPSAVTRNARIVNGFQASIEVSASTTQKKMYPVFYLEF